MLVPPPDTKYEYETDPRARIRSAGFIPPDLAKAIDDTIKLAIVNKDLKLEDVPILVE